VGLLCVGLRAVKRYSLPLMRIHKYAGPYMCTSELSTPGTKSVRLGSRYSFYTLKGDLLPQLGSRYSLFK
jgi:hypothetical protein